MSSSWYTEGDLQKFEHYSDVVAAMTDGNLDACFGCSNFRMASDEDLISNPEIAGSCVVQMTATDGDGVTQVWKHKRPVMVDPDATPTHEIQVLKSTFLNAGVPGDCPDAACPDVLRDPAVVEIYVPNIVYPRDIE